MPKGCAEHQTLPQRGCVDCGEAAYHTVKNNFKIGDPVQRCYTYKNESFQHLNGVFHPAVFFIRRGTGRTVELAQEVWPSSHFSWADLSEIRPAAFTDKADPFLKDYRDEAIARNKWDNRLDEF